MLVGQTVGAEGLDSEGEVHDLDGVSVTGREVDDHAAPDEVDSPAVSQGKLLDVGAYLARGGCAGLETFHVDLHVHPAGVGQDRTVAHPLEVLGGKDVGAARGRDEDLSYLCGFDGG